MQLDESKKGDVFEPRSDDGHCVVYMVVFIHMNVVVLALR